MNRMEALNKCKKLKLINISGGESRKYLIKRLAFYYSCNNHLQNSHLHQRINYRQYVKTNGLNNEVYKWAQMNVIDDNKARRILKSQSILAISNLI